MNKLAIFLDRDINQNNMEKVREIANNYIDNGYSTAIISLNSYSALREKYDQNQIDESFEHFIVPQDERDFTIEQLIVNALIETRTYPKNTLIVLSERISGEPKVEVKIEICKGGF